MTPPVAFEKILGVDVGGTSVKAGLVNTTTGKLLGSLWSRPTPAYPDLPSVVAIVGEIVATATAAARQPSCVGIALPAVIRDGRFTIGIGLAPDWDGADAYSLVSKQLGHSTAIINDADAAGIAEMTYGDGAGERGLVIVLTLGTFIGSAVFHGRRLVPNLELGQLEFMGEPAEFIFGGRAKQTRQLTWQKWAHGFSLYLNALCRWFSPDLIILAGGLTSAADTFLPLLDTIANVKISRFGATAGVIGAAATAAAQQHAP